MCVLRYLVVFLLMAVHERNIIQIDVLFLHAKLIKGDLHISEIKDDDHYTLIASKIHISFDQFSFIVFFLSLLFA